MPVTGDRTVEQTELLIDTGRQISELVGDAFNPALSDEDAPPVIRERDGWRSLHIEGLDPRKLMRADQLAEATVGDWDPDDRIRDQEADGVTAELATRILGGSVPRR